MPQSSRALRTVLLCALPFSLACGDATGLDLDDGLQVLFIGTSLTRWNDLPQILEVMLDSADVGPLRIESVARNGTRLSEHWNRYRAQDTIAAGGWDVVVLEQGLSLGDERDSLLKYTQLFADEAHQVGAQVALYSVWGPRSDPDLYTDVTESYTAAAELVDGFLCPVGEAWRVAFERDPNIALYSEEPGLHPSVSGSYIAALVMFEQFARRTPIGLPSTLALDNDFMPLVEIPSAEALLLQESAHAANREFGEAH